MAQLTMVTESLQDVVARFSDQASGVETTRGDVQGIVAEVEALLNQITTTEPRIISTLQALGVDTTATLSTTLGAEWTGEGAEQFRGSTEELIQFIDQVRERLREAYAEFRTSQDNLRAVLFEVAQEFELRAADGQERTIDFRGKLEGRIGETEGLFSKIVV